MIDFIEFLNCVFECERMLIGFVFEMKLWIQSRFDIEGIRSSVIMLN